MKLINIKARDLYIAILDKKLLFVCSNITEFQKRIVTIKSDIESRVTLKKKFIENEGVLYLRDNLGRVLDLYHYRNPKHYDSKP